MRTPLPSWIEHTNHLIKAVQPRIASISENDGACGGLVRGIIVPREVETCTLDLMRAAAEAARERKMPVAIHAAYNMHEVFDIIREYQMTSIELLDHVGLMSDTLNIGHGNFTADNPLMNYSGAHDLEIMRQHRCSISHCPVTHHVPRLAQRVELSDDSLRQTDLERVGG